MHTKLAAALMKYGSGGHDVYVKISPKGEASFYHGKPAGVSYRVIHVNTKTKPKALASATAMIHAWRGTVKTAVRDEASMKRKGLKAGEVSSMIDLDAALKHMGMDTGKRGKIDHFDLPHGRHAKIIEVDEKGGKRWIVEIIEKDGFRSGLSPYNFSHDDAIRQAKKMASEMRSNPTPRGSRKVRFEFDDKPMTAQGTGMAEDIIATSLSRHIGAPIELWYRGDHMSNGVQYENWRAKWFDAKKDVYREESVLIRKSDR